MNTHYTQRGTGTPLIFIHGGWLSERMWTDQMERFERDYHVISYDIRGHGQTGGSPKSTYSMDLFVDDLRRLLTELSVEMPVLCGLSLGGMIAQKYVDRYPDDVLGVVLANTVQSFPPFPLTQTQKELLFPRLQRHLALSNLGPQSYFRLSFPLFHLFEGHQWISLDRDTRKYALRDSDRISAEEFAKIFDAMYTCDLRTDVSISCPGLVLTSDHETRAVRRQNVRIAESIQHSSHVEIPDAGHLMNMDNPEAFDSAVDRFIADLVVVDDR
ncbi:alpha/beta fold hydrolase [Haladaptatus caseinilyticus]|uniref:alpha/beta fold hydrolase n=1 Tax=Haladaptatus caseinilyticus TaxID=2993314 RepID=UPI00224B20A5|nr:alpha/beta hydrolase [Haladaptatus caseinilyticus]